MKRRICSFLMAVVMVLGFAVQSVYAVTPADPLIASALYSFMISAGLKLWRDGVEGSDTAINELVSDMQTVWGEYSSNNNNVPSWSSIAGITTDNGKIILEHDTAQTFQGFVNWLSSYKSMTPGNIYDVSSGSSGGANEYLMRTIPSDETEGLSLLNNGVWALPVNVGTYIVYTNSSGVYNYLSIEGASGYCFITTTDYSNAKSVCFCSESNFIVKRQSFRDGQPTGVDTFTPYLITLNNVSRPNKEDGSFEFYCYHGLNLSSSTGIGAAVNPYTGYNSPLYEMSYVALAGDTVGTQSDLFVKVGQTVFDRVRDLLDDQSLALDVGLGTTAGEEDIIATVSGIYAEPAEGAIVSGVVATPVPLEGQAELYPQAESASDVDGLGLPALGKALTTRFPFCIPWDVVYLYQSLNATPQRPVIDIDLFPAQFKQRVGIVGDTSFTFDIGDQKYEMLLKVVRWSTLVGFVLGLAFATKRLIWTTGG